MASSAVAAPYAQDVIVTPTLLADLRDALGYIEPEDYFDWERIGEALKTLGEAGKPLWHEWSARSKRYNWAEAEAKWNSFKAERTGYGAIFAEAQRRRDGGARVVVLAPAAISLPDGVTRLCVPPDDAGFARVLYAFLREADALGDLILAVPPAESGLGLAVRDRLQRASRPRP